MAWRFVVELDGGVTRAVRAETVADLRRLIAYARRRPDVRRYTWHRIRIIHGARLTHCPCGQPFESRFGPQYGRARDCRCGLMHRIYLCSCGQRVPDPPWTRGCGPLPWSPLDFASR